MVGYGQASGTYRIFNNGKITESRDVKIVEGGTHYAKLPAYSDSDGEAVFTMETEAAVEPEAQQGPVAQTQVVIRDQPVQDAADAASQHSYEVAAEDTQGGQETGSEGEAEHGNIAAQTLSRRACGQTR
jgi:hypothetical protein